MKRRQYVFVLTVFLVGLGLLSLPFKKNIAIRDALASKASTLWRFVSFQEAPQTEKTALDAWLIQTEQERILAQEKARFLTPNNQTYLVGKVLYRAINSYNSALWIDLGSDSNSAALPQIIAKNSPVLSGDSVIGVIDYVGHSASLVRLITDPELTPSVRVLRQTGGDKQLSFAVHTLKQALKENSSLLQSEEKRKAMQWLLNSLADELAFPPKPLFLAKGILQGQGEALWRTPSPLLKGSGFNYDFDDKHGPARDLRTGELTGGERETCPIIQVGDLLVTSGMDGVFPEGLKIATVHTITPLTEGAYAYELLATPTAEELMDLQYVTVLPPQGFDLSSMPEPVDKVVQLLQNS